jgi:L-rhamnose mutarotase
MTRRYCLALDLKDDPELIAEYRKQHRRIWPEVTRHLRDSGVVDMQIWQLGTRLFMVMDVAAGFDFAEMDRQAEADSCLQQWEALMWRFQQPTPWTPDGSKWAPMEQIFNLADQPGSAP